MVFFLCDDMLLLVRRSVALFCPDSNSDYVGWLINLIAWSSLFSWGVMDPSRHDVAGVFVLAWFFFCVSHFFAPFSEVDARVMYRLFFSVTDFWDFDVYLLHGVFVVWFYLCVRVAAPFRQRVDVPNLVAFRWKRKTRC
jgi:hypothetical protein